MMWPPAAAALLGPCVCSASRHSDASAPRALTLLLASRAAPAQHTLLSRSSKPVERDSTLHINLLRARLLDSFAAWHPVVLCARLLLLLPCCNTISQPCHELTPVTYEMLPHQ